MFYLKAFLSFKVCKKKKEKKGVKGLADEQP